VNASGECISGATSDMTPSLRHRWPPEKAVAVAVAVAPALWLAGLGLGGELGVRAVHEAIKYYGVVGGQEVRIGL
jgi:hypothetical protein